MECILISGKGQCEKEKKFEKQTKQKNEEKATMREWGMSQFREGEGEGEGEREREREREGGRG